MTRISIRMQEQFRGTISYQEKQFDYIAYVSSARRTRTVQIQVLRDLTVKTLIPAIATQEKVEEILQNRAYHLLCSIERMKQHERIDIAKYDNGSKHLFLSKVYSLCIKSSLAEKVYIDSDSLVIETMNTQEANIKELLKKWYITQTKEHYTKLFDECWEVFNSKYPDYTKPSLRISKLQSAWGHIKKPRKGEIKTSDTKVTLNLSMIQASHECIKQVIFHEFSHLLHSGHNYSFYKVLQSLYPDWRKAVKELNSFGMDMFV